jgi:hypothetical protein
VKKLFTLFASLVLLSASARATLDYTYTGPGLADGSGQITITYPTNYTGGSKSESGIYVGQLNMSNPLDASTFNAFCLSPAGNLTGTQAYNVLTLESAKYGLNPAAWSLTGGIENAAYIWTLKNANINTAAEGAALNLAMWAALYNSTAVGATTGSGLFSVTGAGYSSAIETAFNADIAQLNSASQSAILANFSTNPGYILRPVNASMQDLIVLPSSIPESMRVQMASAPEPSTILGIAFLGLLVMGQMVTERLKLPESAKA